MGPSRLTQLSVAVAPVDDAAAAAATARHDVLLKPPGSLGLLEDVGVRLSAIAGRCPPPRAANPAVVIAAADHGVHARGVTPWPQRITTQMVDMFGAGGTAAGTLADTVGASVTVIDVGCVQPPIGHPRLRSRRIRAGTADLSRGAAMRREEAEHAAAAGAEVTNELLDEGVDLVVTGDMGIASTTASACLTAALADADADAVTGPGAGTLATMATKLAIVEQALDLHRPDPGDPLGVLAAVGGLEHAALVGVMLAAAARRVPILLDGAITTAAALVAAALAPTLRGYLLASHRSPEPGATVALGHLRLTPLLDLGLRLGEGTGGLIAVPLVQSAARVLGEMATLDDLTS